MCRELLSQLAPEHQVEAFASARELAQALADGAPFDLLCLDILMEGQNGMEFLLRSCGRKTSASASSSSRAAVNI